MRKALVKQMPALKGHKLTISLILIWIFSSVALLLRPTTNIDLLKLMRLNGDPDFSQYVALRDDGIRYEAYQTEDQEINFDAGKDILQCTVGHLNWGTYLVEIDYHTSYDTSQENKQICTMSFEDAVADRHTRTADTIFLHDYKSNLESPLWVKYPQGSEEVTLNCSFTGSGICEISSIRLREYGPWKIGFLLTQAALFAVIWFWYYKLRTKSTKEKLGWLFVIAVVIFASLPALAGNFWACLSPGHDYSYHMARIASIANEIRYGNFPVLYQSDAGNGFGYVAHLLYGNLFLYLPALLFLLGFPLTASHNIFVVLINFSTYGIAYYSFKGMFGKRRYAHLGAAVYLLCAYRLTDIYIRSAMGEYLAMAFLPLALYGLQRIITSKGSTGVREILPFVIGITGIVESHILTMEMIAIFLGLLFLVNIYLYSFQSVAQKFLAFVKAGIAILGLNAFFLVPFLEAYQYPLVVTANARSANIQPHAAYLSQLFDLFMKPGGKGSTTYTNSDMPLTIGASLVIGAVLFLLVCICKKEWKCSEKEKTEHKLAMGYFVLAALALWLASVHFPWAVLADRSNWLIRIFTAVQFPWRYLAIATVLLSFVTVYSVKMLEEHGISCLGVKKAGVIFSILLVSVSVIVAGDYYRIHTADAAMAHALAAEEHVDDLYLPVGMEDRRYDTSIHCEPADGAEVVRVGTTKENDKLFLVKRVKEDCTVTFPIIYYDYLTAVNEESGEPLETAPGYNEQLAVKLERGYTGTIRVSYKMKWQWKVAYCVSALSVAMLGALMIKETRKRKQV